VIPATELDALKSSCPPETTKVEKVTNIDQLLQSMQDSPESTLGSIESGESKPVISIISESTIRASKMVEGGFIPRGSKIFTTDTSIPEHIISLVQSGQNQRRDLVIQILKGEHIMISLPNGKQLGNPFVRVIAQTRKGIKTKNTKAKRFQMDPLWRSDKFTFRDVIFPVHCKCLNAKKTRTNLEEVEDKLITAKGDEGLIGEFFIEKDQLPTPDHPIYKWYHLEPPKNPSNPTPNTNSTYNPLRKPEDGPRILVAMTLTAPDNNKT